MRVALIESHFSLQVASVGIPLLPCVIAMAASTELISSVVTERAVAEGIVVEVCFNNGMWWEIPDPQVAGAYVDGWSEIVYTYDWGTARPGSWSPDGERTSINRYLINFQTMKQQNIDNGRTRDIRVMCAATR